MSTGFSSSIYEDWTTISIGAAALSVLATAALIMLSRLFSLKNLEQVAKSEFVYAISTVLIVIMAVGIIEPLEIQLAAPNSGLARCLYLTSLGQPCTAALPQMADPPTTLIDWMKLYMETPTKCVQRFMDVLYALEIPVGAMTSFYMEIFMSEHAGGFGLKWVEERILNSTQSFSFYMYMYFLLAHCLNFVKHYAGFFFSFGVMLRAFPPTRGAGAYVMALAFGLYFVFPLSYILIATLGLPHVQSNIMDLDVNAVGGPEYICVLPQVPDMEPWQCGTADLGKFLDMRSLLISNRDELGTMMSLRMWDYEKHLTNSLCVFPLIAFVLLLTFVLNTTTLFGGNIPEIGRGLVKLI
ncbi:MAG: hypothetical protein V1827_04270 [Candidatus Micrarchaeota archaeon]